MRLRVDISKHFPWGRQYVGGEEHVVEQNLIVVGVPSAPGLMARLEGGGCDKVVSGVDVVFAVEHVKHDRLVRVGERVVRDTLRSRVSCL